MNNQKCLESNHLKGITLIALVITIIVLLILAGVSLTLITGNNGIITKARWAAFSHEMQSIDENVKIALADAATAAYFEQEIELPYSTQPDVSTLPETLLNEVQALEGNTANLYYINRTEANGKENTYLFEDNIKIVFKITGINIYGTTIHSYEYGVNAIPNLSRESNQIPTVSMEVTATYGYYEPDLNGFDPQNTYIEYYSSDFNSTIEIPVQEYLEGGKRQTIESNGETYTFYDYKNIPNQSTWGNIKTYANGQECWWTWIPRYGYKADRANKTMEIMWTSINNKILQENGIEGEDITSQPGYIAHTAFTESYTDINQTVQNVKELYGIWMSKYNASDDTSLVNLNISQTVLPPNMIGYNINTTYIETYDATGTDVQAEYLLKDILKSGYTADLNGVLISGEVDPSKVQNGIWYDYGKRVWANIKTTANSSEAWWVWIPRYSYYINNLSKKCEIMYVDMNNQPLNPNNLDCNEAKAMYTVHPAFEESYIDTDGNTHKVKDLSGIWMSKYNASEGESLPTLTVSKIALAPNMIGYNINTTYIETYDDTGTNIQAEYLLKDMLESGYTADQNGILISGEVDQSKIENGLWYDYGKRIWANIKTTANGLEAWWVWIPRYSYYINTSSKRCEITYIDMDNQPLNPDDLDCDEAKAMYTVHPAFEERYTDAEGNTHKIKDLSGIWMSKYNTSGTPTAEELEISVP